MYKHRVDVLWAKFESIPDKNSISPRRLVQAETNEVTPGSSLRTWGNWESGNTHTPL